MSATAKAKPVVLDEDRTEKDALVQSDLSPQWEVMQQGQVDSARFAVKPHVGTDPDRAQQVLYNLPSGRELDLVEFMVEHTQSIANGSLRDHVRSVFLQFFARLTAVCAESTTMCKVLLGNKSLCGSLLEVLSLLLREVKPKGNGVVELVLRDAMDLSNVFTILQNYLALDVKPFIEELSSPSLPDVLACSFCLVRAVVVPKVLLASVDAGNLTEDFRQHLVEFWNCVVNRRVLSDVVHAKVLHALAWHPEFTSVVNHLVGATHNEALVFLRLLLNNFEVLSVLKSQHTPSCAKILLDAFRVMLRTFNSLQIQEADVAPINKLDGVVNLLADSSFLQVVWDYEDVRARLFDMLGRAAVNRAFFRPALPEAKTSSSGDATPDVDATSAMFPRRTMTCKTALLLFRLYLRMNDHKKFFLRALALEAHTKPHVGKNIVQHLDELKQIAATVAKDANISEQELDHFTKFSIQFQIEAGFLPVEQKETAQPYVQLRDNVYVGTREPKFDPSTVSICHCKLSRQKKRCHDMGCSNRRAYVECIQSICGPYCTNNKIQQGSFPAVSTGSQFGGTGLRAVDPVRRGEVVVEYVGEVVPLHQFILDRTRRSANRQNCRAVMMDGLHVIDASMKGNVSRFINHSCAPNAMIQRWLVAGRVRVVLVATQYIRAGRMVTVDYHKDFVGGTAHTCLCSQPNCKRLIVYTLDDDTKEPATVKKQKKQATAGQLAPVSKRKLKPERTKRKRRKRKDTVDDDEKSPRPGPGYPPQTNPMMPPGVPGVPGPNGWGMPFPPYPPSFGGYNPAYRYPYYPMMPAAYGQPMGGPLGPMGPLGAMGPMAPMNPFGYPPGYGLPPQRAQAPRGRAASGPAAQQSAVSAGYPMHMVPRATPQAAMMGAPYPPPMHMRARHKSGQSRIFSDFCKRHSVPRGGVHVAIALFIHKDRVRRGQTKSTLPTRSRPSATYTSPTAGADMIRALSSSNSSAYRSGLKLGSVPTGRPSGRAQTAYASRSSRSDPSTSVASTQPRSQGYTHGSLFGVPPSMPTSQRTTSVPASSRRPPPSERITYMTGTYSQLWSSKSNKAGTTSDRPTNSVQRTNSRGNTVFSRAPRPNQLHSPKSGPKWNVRRSAAGLFYMGQPAHSSTTASTNGVRPSAPGHLPMNTRAPPPPSNTAAPQPPQPLPPKRTASTLPRTAPEPTKLEQGSVPSVFPAVSPSRAGLAHSPAAPAPPGSVHVNAKPPVPTGTVHTTTKAPVPPGTVHAKPPIVHAHSANAKPLAVAAPTASDAPSTLAPQATTTPAPQATSTPAHQATSTVAPAPPVPSAPAPPAPRAATT